MTTVAFIQEYNSKNIHSSLTSNLGGATNTKLALNVVRNLILPSSYRHESKKALFLLTDGGSNLGSPKKIADILQKQENVEIYLIGIGNRIRDNLLRHLASKVENVFAITSYKDLKKVLKIIVKMPFKGKLELHWKNDKISQQSNKE